MCGANLRSESCACARVGCGLYWLCTGCQPINSGAMPSGRIVTVLALAYCCHPPPNSITIIEAATTPFARGDGEERIRTFTEHVRPRWELSSFMVSSRFRGSLWHPVSQLPLVFYCAMYCAGNKTKLNEIHALLVVKYACVINALSTFLLLHSKPY